MDIRVPDIGDFKDVPVIEVLVKPGDRVKKNDSLIALESDKATMEVPSPEDGTVEELKIRVGDKVSQGTVVLTLAEENRDAPSLEATLSPSKPEIASAPASEEASTSSAVLRQAQHDTVQGNKAGQLVDITVPDIGDFIDVPVIDVLVKPGDRVEKDASLIALESEKATMEVPATTAGTIRDVRVRVGDKVSKGSVIVTVEASTSQGQASTVAVPPSIPQVRSILQDDVSAEPRHRDMGNGVVHASPSIRRFARELGVDLHRIAPSGPNGRITREDVQQFVKRSLQNGSPAASGSGLHLAPWPKIDFAQFGEIERKPLSRIKRLSGANLQRNWVTIPHVTHNDDADVTDLETFRAALNAESAKSGVKITMLAFLMTASIAALKKFPEFNSSLDGDDLVYKNYYNIGFAADTPAGLVVPVVRNADRKGLAELASESAALAAKAREGKLTSVQMQGGTFTISSLGSIGGTYFTPIINAPEVAILGACRAAMRPVWDGKQFAPRLMQPLSLSYDHRVIDGAAAARFVTFLTTVLSDLRRALL